MKVAIAFPGCHRRAGVERVMLECTNYLASRGHETHAFAIDWDSDSSAIDPRIIKHPVAVSSSNYLVRLAGFIRETRREIRSLSPPASVLAGFGIESPPNSVVWMQSVHRAWLEISSQQRDLTGRLKQKVNPAHAVILALEKRRFVNRDYSKIVALSPHVKADIVRLYSVPEQDIVVIPNGFSPSEFSFDIRLTCRERVRTRLGLQVSDKVVIFVANELERKGFHPLLRAIYELNDPNIHLLAVGRLNSEVYGAEIERLGMSTRVHYTGASGTVSEFYAAADLFVLPTQYEAWGLVIIEAMACGLPVVTSRIAGASVAVKENQTGILLDHPHETDEIIEAMRPFLSGNNVDARSISESVSEYAWDKVLQQYETVLTASAE
jgi:UDP-glucose:(heptosyl)LPS alpha-1,3-glucosyltransferase